MTDPRQEFPLQDSDITAIANALKAALSSDKPDKVEQLSSTLKNVEDARKANTEAGNMHRIQREERLRFWIPILAPLLGSVALIATLYLQIRQTRQSQAQFEQSTKNQMNQFRQSTQIQEEQFRQSTQTQIDSREDSEWRDVLQMAKNTHGAEGIFGITLLKSFLKSPRYSADARQIAVEIVSGIIEPDDFNMLYSSIVERTDWTNLNDLPTISRGLEVGWHIAQNEKSDRQEQTSKRQARQKAMADYSVKLARYEQQSQIYQFQIQHNPQLAGKLTPPIKPVAPTWDDDLLMYPRSQSSQFLEDPSTVMDKINTNERTVANTIVTFLKRKDYPASFHLILDGADFYLVDMSGADFHGASMNGMGVESSDVRDANFGAVTQYQNSFWDHTAWWRAARISPGLLEYLRYYYPYSGKQTYYNDGTKSVKEYLQEVERIKRLNQMSPNSVSGGPKGIRNGT